MYVMKRMRYITVAALVVAALWIGRPQGLCAIYRGYLEGRASGALVFSLVQAVGESAARGFPTNN
jgi:hypothetical protein